MLCPTLLPTLAVAETGSNPESGLVRLTPTKPCRLMNLSRLQLPTPTPRLIIGAALLVAEDETRSDSSVQVLSTCNGPHWRSPGVQMWQESSPLCSCSLCASGQCLDKAKFPGARERLEPHS
jgi:hypothetical protein